MTRTLMVVAAVSGLAMSSALAQTPAPQNPTNPSAIPTPASPPVATTAKAGGAQIVNSQSKQEWLASKLKGTSVMGSDGQKIGSISDILLDKDGQVKAFVVGIGGVLGIGAKEVAVDMKQFHEMQPTSGGQEQLKVDMSKDQLAQAEEFKPLPNPATTTGSAPAGTRPTSQRPASPP
jgi:sporulation protein YlmC with PRC-barrel domain